MDATQVVGALSFMLLIGILISILSTKIKIPNMFLLILFGMALTIPSLNYDLESQFPLIFIATIALITLIIIVFEGATAFTFKDFDDYSLASIKLYFIFLFLSVVFLTPAVYYFFGKISWYYALLFSIVMTATAAEIILVMFKVSPNKAVNVLKFESVLNDIFTILLPIMVISFMTGYQASVSLPAETKLFFQQIIVGVGVGIIGWLFLFKIFKINITENYIKNLSQISLIICAMAVYVIADRFDGSGILAVTVFGLFVGNSYINKIFNVESYAPFFSNLFEILVFVFAGIIIKIPFTDYIFLIKGTLLYAFFMLIRYMSVEISFRETITRREKWFMTLLIPKGVSAATLILLIATYNLPGIGPILNLMMFFILISIVIGTIGGRYTNYFLAKKTT